MMGMAKIDIAALEAAYHTAEAGVSSPRGLPRASP